MTPSLFQSLKKLRELLTRGQKVKVLSLAGLATINSLTEVLTASFVIVFAQLLTNSTAGDQVFNLLDLQDLSHGKKIFYASIIFGSAYIIKNVLSAFEVFYLNTSIQKMGYDFKKIMLLKFVKADYAKSLSRNASYNAAVINEAEAIFTNALVPLSAIFSESVSFISLIGLIIYMNPVLAGVVFILGGTLGLFTSKVLFPLFYKWGTRIQEASLLSGQTLYQFFHGFKEIFLLGKQEPFISAYNEHSLIKAKSIALQSATNQLPRMVLEVLFIFIFVLTICVLCLEHETPVSMMGTLGGYLYVGFRVMPGLNRILNQLNTVKSSTPYIERVYKEYTTLEMVDTYASIKDFTFKESLKLQQVFYRYPNTAKDVLEDITLEIKKGSCIGIIGQTGSGKSTLVDLILGLLKPTKGSILIDGQYPVNCEQWHKAIGYVPQSIYLIDDTIEANIVFGDESIDEIRLNESIKAAQLGKFIEKLPQGVKTIVGERGVRLSGGERQRIAIARALYRNPDVLIFDEATSALDNETESKLMETIHAVSQNRTVIMIAHRLTTLRDCSAIIHLENGLMKDMLTYDQLINKENLNA